MDTAKKEELVQKRKQNTVEIRVKRWTHGLKHLKRK